MTRRTAAGRWALTGLLALSACGSSSDDALGCGPILRESLAPDAGVHVIASAPVTYASEPPTSGPHAPGPELGVYERTLTGPEQVGVLERGDVVVQYDPDLVQGSLAARFSQEVGATTVVFPAPELGERMVVTAWRVRMTCADLDPSAVAEFVEEFGGQGDPHSVEGFDETAGLKNTTNSDDG